MLKKTPMYKAVLIGIVVGGVAFSSIGLFLPWLFSKKIHPLLRFFWGAFGVALGGPLALSLVEPLESVWAANSHSERRVIVFLYVGSLLLSVMFAVIRVQGYRSRENS